MTPADIDYASIYDSFTITVLQTIEDLGFCEKGEGGRFVLDGALQAPHGRLPFNTVIWYPRGFCPTCSSFDIEWFDPPGTGEVYSFSIPRRGQGAYRDAAPYVVAYVELDLPDGVGGDGPGPRIMTNLVECDPWSVSVGDRVRAVFHATERGVALVRFRPA